MAKRFAYLITKCNFEEDYDGEATTKERLVGVVLDNEKLANRIVKSLQAKEPPMTDEEGELVWFCIEKVLVVE